MYILKEDLKTLWDYRHVGYAWRFWLDWYARAIHSRIEPLKSDFTINGPERDEGSPAE